ncbi:MAG: hypothetical protein ACI8T1_005420 [Verrucomicrobiales bacterium]|jgi:hypothetical protein
MKLTLSLTYLAMAMSVHAATIAASNLPGNVPVPIRGADGFTLASSSISIGTFTGSDPAAIGAAGDIAGLKNAFIQFGDSVSVGFNGLAGLYQNTVTGTVRGTAFSGAKVYTMIGDCHSVATSCGLFVVDHGFTFTDEPGATPDAVLKTDSHVLLGYSTTSEIEGTAHEGFGLVGNAVPCSCPPIPEPSSAWLGIISLGFLMFRRSSARKEVSNQR